MPKPLYTYILNIYDLVGFECYGSSVIVGFFYAKSLYTLIAYDW